MSLAIKVWVSPKKGNLPKISPKTAIFAQELRDVQPRAEPDIHDGSVTLSLRQMHAQHAGTLTQFGELT
jgi:hypothetical protein